MYRVETDSYNKSQRDALFLKFILVNNSTCFGQIYCPSSGVLIPGVDKSLPRPERKQATATEDFDFHIAYL